MLYSSCSHPSPGRRIASSASCRKVVAFKCIHSSDRGRPRAPFSTCFLGVSVNILIKIHPLFHVLVLHRSQSGNRSLGCADSFRRIRNSCRLISLRCFCRRRCNPPASSQIVLVLLCIQTFDRSNWFVDHTRNFDSDLTESRLSCCCSASFLHPSLGRGGLTPFLLFLSRHSYLCIYCNFAVPL